MKSFKKGLALCMVLFMVMGNLFAITQIDTGGVADDLILDTKIDWGTGANQVSGGDIPLVDSGTYFDTDDVESALQELGADISGITNSIWEVSSNVVRGISGEITYSTDDFVFGSDQLGDKAGRRTC